MGEKIKDLGQINIAGNEFTVELNEGYSKNEGKLIHIQNSKFRYLLSDKQFMIMATMILRANQEFHYLKKHNRNKKLIIKKSIKLESLKKSFNFNVIQDIDYRLVSYNDKVISLIIKKKDKENLKNILNKNKYMKIDHPYNSSNGYIYLYKMDEFELFSNGKMLIEIFYQLPAKSLTKNNFMPLDLMIQNSIFTNNVIKNNIKILDIENKIIYILVCLFYNMGYLFDDDIRLIRQHIGVLDSKTFKEKMKLIFFNYSEQLIRMIKKEDYQGALDGYMNFNNY